MASGASTLCVIFNHPYIGNIPIIGEAVGQRFDEIVFVVPNTRVDDPSVITSYRASYNFHGMIVDACEKLLSSNSEYFFFLQDDVLLNPRFSGQQWVELLKLEDGGAFFPDAYPLGGDIPHWLWTAGFVWKTAHPKNPFSGSGIENWKSLLPDADMAFRDLKAKYQLQFHPFTYDRTKPVKEGLAVNEAKASNAIVCSILEGLFVANGGKPIDLGFPFMFGVSDFFAVNRQTLIKMSHMLGVLSAMQTFVEIAIPTALFVTADRVHRSADVGLKADWYGPRNGDTIDVEAALNAFDKDLLLLHPVKVSKSEREFRKVFSHYD